jgi:hypothetical protein
MFLCWSENTLLHLRRVYNSRYININIIGTYIYYIILCLTLQHIMHIIIIFIYLLIQEPHMYFRHIYYYYYFADRDI